jgi:hypothetical protein
LFRWIPQQSCIEMMEIEYSSLIHERVPIIHQMAEFLQRELDSEKVLPAIDSQLYRNREDKNR